MSASILEIIFLIVAGGGGLIALVKLFVDLFSKNSIRSRNLLITNLNFWKMENEKNLLKLEERDKRIYSLLEEIVNLKIQVIEKKSDFESIPLIYARLDSKARMLNFTHLYTKTFIKPYYKNPFEYFGKTSMEFWGEEIGKEYTENDLEVLRTGSSFYGTEVFMQNGQNVLEDYIVYKWISFSDSGEKNLNVLFIDDEEIVNLFKRMENATKKSISRGRKSGPK